MIINIQKVNRQPSFGTTEMYPPMIGPRSGPAKGIMLYIDAAIPRSRGIHMSDITPPALDNAVYHEREVLGSIKAHVRQEPNRPANSRVTMMVVIF